jgi:hypothetical protein
VPGEAAYFDVACVAERPESGDAYSWYDEVRLVEWESWQSASSPLPIELPNNLRFLQVRLSDPADSASVWWEDQVPDGLASDLPEDAGPIDAVARLLRGMPNPFNQGTTIEYRLPSPGQVRIEIFDLGGRRVALLENRFRPAGTHRLRWGAADLAVGLYLCRMEIGGESWTEKLVHLR